MSDPTKTIVNVEAASDFLVQRAELRHARARWVDEHERPIPMVVLDDKGEVAYPSTFKDKDGNERPTPFMVGCQTYSDDIPHEADPSSATGYKRPGVTFIPEAATEDQGKVMDQLQEVTRQYHQFSGTMVRDGDGGEVPLSHRSNHPAIREGETHEEWFNRVSKTYSDTEEARAYAGSTGTDVDGLRRSAGHDPGDGRQASPNGAEVRGGTPHAALHRKSEPDGAGGPSAIASDYLSLTPAEFARAHPPARRPNIAARAAAAAIRCLRALFR